MADDSQLEYEDEQVDEQPAQRPGAAQRSGSELPIKEGAVFGAIAVIVTYLTHFYLTVVAAGQNTPITYTEDGSVVVTEQVSTWVGAGWSYLSAFGVGFEVEGETVALSDAPNNVAALSNTPFLFSDLAVFAVTVGAAIAAGYGVTKYTGTEGPIDSIKASLMVVIPYVAFAAVAAFLMTHAYTDESVAMSLIDDVTALQGDQFFNDEGGLVTDPEISASTTDALLFAGVLFPALFAILGGLATQWRETIDSVIAEVQQRT